MFKACSFVLVGEKDKLIYKALYGRNFRVLAGMGLGQTCMLQSNAKRKKVSFQPRFVYAW